MNYYVSNNARESLCYESEMYIMPGLENLVSRYQYSLLSEDLLYTII